jgi:hypothetical protein
MKRTSTVFVSIATAVVVMAIMSAPAGASTGYPSITRTALTGGSGSAVAQRDQIDRSSINATLRAPAPKQHVGSSVSAVVGARDSAVPVTTVVRQQSGFDWGDAFAGAAGALVLALISLATVQLLRRRGGATLESRV